MRHTILTKPVIFGFFSNTGSGVHVGVIVVAGPGVDLGAALRGMADAVSRQQDEPVVDLGARLRVLDALFWELHGGYWARQLLLRLPSRRTLFETACKWYPRTVQRAEGRRMLGSVVYV